MALLIDGPRLAPASGGRPNALVVLLHGYGSNGDDLIALARHWTKLLPQAQFVAPDGPDPVPGAPGGRQWFPIARLDPRLMAAGAAGAAPGLDRFLDRELERYGLEDGRLALVGFSQGAMMALHVGLRRPKPPAAILALSGMLASSEGLEGRPAAKPPVLLIHGDQDEVIPVGAMFSAAQALCAAGYGAQWHVSYGVPHAIGPDGVELGGAFLRMGLAGAS